MKVILLLTIGIFLIGMSCKESTNPPKENTVVADTGSAQAEVQPNDQIIQYYENGQIKYMQQFLNGIRHGQYRDWYKTGQVRTDGLFSLGMRTGKWSWFSEKGEVNLQINYDNPIADL